MATRFLEATPYGRICPVNPARLQAVVETCFALGVIFVAEVERQVVGMIALVALNHPFTGTRYADELAWWVEPEYRHTLLGTRLLRWAESWALEQGLAFVKMIAPADSSVGAVYARMGYQAVETAYHKEL